MQGKIIDINSTDAFILLNDGNTIAVSLSSLPNDLRIGSSININSIAYGKPTSNYNPSNNFLI